MTTKKPFNITIPPAFASGVIAERGKAGQEWLENLPAKFEKLCNAWDLVIDGMPAHGYLGLVVPVRRGNEACVLKVTWPGETTDEEILALKIWNGVGAVRLLNALPEDGALLLERLDNTQTLETVDIKEAVITAGRLLRRLSVVAPQGVPTLSEHVEKTSITMTDLWRQLDKPFPERLLSTAQNIIQELAPSTANLIVDYDLHYANVLAGKREPWLVIDPKIFAGDPEFGVFPLLLNRSEDVRNRDGLERRFETLVEVGQLELQRARGWTFIRAVDYWLWALNIGLTEDPTHCQLIATWLLDDL